MWNELCSAGLTEREVRSIKQLGSNPKMKASELAKELDTTRTDPTTASHAFRRWASSRPA